MKIFNWLQQTNHESLKFPPKYQIKCQTIEFKSPFHYHVHCFRPKNTQIHWNHKPHNDSTTVVEQMFNKKGSIQTDNERVVVVLKHSMKWFWLEQKKRTWTYINPNLFNRQHKNTRKKSHECHKIFRENNIQSSTMHPLFFKCI